MSNDEGTCPRCGSSTWEDNLYSGCNNDNCGWGWDGNNSFIAIVPASHPRPERRHEDEDDY
jgi:hypothetical protein